MLDATVKEVLLDGTVIPAHPLALHDDKTLDEISFRRLTRYYIEAGVGGLAVGVHTTQFEIHDDFELYKKVLTLAVTEIDAHATSTFVKVAGVSGDVEQAKKEANIAKQLGYHCVLLSNNRLGSWSEEQLLERAVEIGKIMPIIGFYLQPSVGGRIFSKDYWAKFVENPAVCAIKIAPFDRYCTIDVAEAVLNSERRDEIALYTGNDDTIIHDLFTTFKLKVNGQHYEKRIVGGLLGHWAVWTSKVVELFEAIKRDRELEAIPVRWFTLAQQVTHANAAFFDTRNQFKGSIAGINEVLRRQGLLKNNLCISEHEVLSEGQSTLIDQIYELYPHLHDDEFVQRFLEKEAMYK